VNVTGEMNGESQGFRLLAGIARNTKDFDLLLEGIRDAAANVRAIFVKVCSRGPSRDIDEVPIAGFRVLAAVVVRPG